MFLWYTETVFSWYIQSLVPKCAYFLSLSNGNTFRSLTIPKRKWYLWGSKSVFVIILTLLLIKVEFFFFCLHILHWATESEKYIILTLFYEHNYVNLSNLKFHPLCHTKSSFFWKSPKWEIIIKFYQNVIANTIIYLYTSVCMFNTIFNNISVILWFQVILNDRGNQIVHEKTTDL